jgi:hypothetical protein
VDGAKNIWERSQNEHDAITLSTYTKRESWFLNLIMQSLLNT